MLALMASALFHGAIAHADVAAGDVITGANVDKAKALISPGVEWIVKRGMKMKIIEPRKVEMPKAYKEATEKYSGQVKLGSDGLTLENYTAGQPFPNIDPNDPNVAIKIMWNYEYNFHITDDVDLREFDADTGPIGESGAGMSVERHFILDHFRRLYYNGRLVVDPKP